MNNLNFDSVFFFPWIGTDYNNGGIFKKKILILGESHYCEDPGVCSGCTPGVKDSECNLLTQKVIKGQFTDGEKKHSIFTKLAKLLLDKETIEINDKENFWNSVAFYNYVQTSVASGARVAPNDKMFSNSFQSFNEVMDKLDPDFLLIVSCRLWKNLPGRAGIEWPAGPIIEENNIVEKTWYYKGKRKNTLSIVIYHPSSPSFSYEYSSVVRKALSLS
jgi:hypothetical protein